MKFEIRNGPKNPFVPLFTPIKTAMPIGLKPALDKSDERFSRYIQQVSRLSFDPVMKGDAGRMLLKGIADSIKNLDLDTARKLADEGYKQGLMTNVDLFPKVALAIVQNRHYIKQKEGGNTSELTLGKRIVPGISMDILDKAGLYNSVNLVKEVLIRAAGDHKDSDIGRMFPQYARNKRTIPEGPIDKIHTLHMHQGCCHTDRFNG